MSKKQLIIKHAIELFANKGFESTSIQEITEQCGISKGAFYLSFKSKDELIISIIDHCMSELSFEVDRVVNSHCSGDHMLYSLYFTIFDFFEKHRKFAIIFTKEQLHPMNQELLARLVTYDVQFSNSILKLIDYVYGAEVETIKYDLLFCIKGNMHTFSEYLLLRRLPLNVPSLAHSLVDKTNAIARHATIGYVTEEMFNSLSLPIEQTMTLQQCIAQIEQLLNSAEDRLEAESLTILRDQLQAKDASEAIIRGMMNTLKTYSRCKLLIIYLEQLLEK